LPILKAFEIVAVMESNPDIAQELRQADRAAAAPYVDYPATPAWYPPATGLWAAAFCLSTALGSATRAAVLGLLVVLELGLATWYRRRRGTWPRGRAPRELRPVLVGFVSGAVVIGGGLGALLALTEAWIAAAVAFVLVTLAVGWYERAYARAAARTRARLG
jgi:hypothetical protein